MTPSDVKKLKRLLDERAAAYERPEFIAKDPISIPHRFSKKEDREIAGFFASLIAWGNRTAILKSADTLMTLMHNEPYSFLTKASASDFDALKTFYYRTLNGEDTLALARAVRRIYTAGGFEPLFAAETVGEPLIVRLGRFRKALIKDMPRRTVKHIADMEGGSAAKRLNMFLRWMVRSAKNGVDFGLWKTVSPAELYLPLDVHAARQGRALGLLTCKQNGRKAVEEITANLRLLCPEDPIKYDFALFGAAVSIMTERA